MKTFILTAAVLFATALLMPPKLIAQSAKEALPEKEKSILENTDKVQKELIPVKSLRKEINEVV